MRNETTETPNLPATNRTAENSKREIRIVEDYGPEAYLMDTARFEHMQRIATLMAHASFLPEHLKGRDVNQAVANCFRICNQAMRWGFDPFAIQDETYVVHGRLGYQGKLVAAVVNARAGLRSRLRYEHVGKGVDRTVKVIGHFKNETEPRWITLSVGQAQTKNPMWTNDPDQKLIYSGVIKWARAYCPEILLGVLTDDDLDRIAESRPEVAAELAVGKRNLRARAPVSNMAPENCQHLQGKVDPRQQVVLDEDVDPPVEEQPPTPVREPEGGSPPEPAEPVPAVPASENALWMHELVADYESQIDASENAMTTLRLLSSLDKRQAELPPSEYERLTALGQAKLAEQDPPKNPGKRKT